MFGYIRNKLTAKKEIAKLLATTLPIVNNVIADNKRISEIIGYIFTLSAEDMRKIILNAEVETMHKNK